MFIIEGNIRALRVAQGTVNLIQDIQQGTWFTGLAAGLSGQAGMMANAASLALYDGEAVEHIALLINDRLAIGTFEWLEDLKIDDEVKVVVSEVEDGPLFIHAILRKNDKFLWMPLAVAQTRFGLIKHGIKSTLWASGAILLMVAIISFIGNMSLFKNYGILLVTLTVLMTSFAEYMSTAGLMPMAERAEDIYLTLGVAKFKEFEITPFSLTRVLGVSSPNALKKGNIYKFDSALQAHKMKHRLE